MRIGVNFLETFISFFRDTLDGPLYVVMVIVNTILILLCLKYLLAYYFNVGIKKAKSQAEMDDALSAAQALVPAGATIQSTGLVALPVDSFSQPNVAGNAVISPVAQPSNVVVVGPNGMPISQHAVQPVVTPMQSFVQPVQPVVQPVVQSMQSITQPMQSAIPSPNVVIVQPNGVPVQPSNVVIVGPNGMPIQKRPTVSPIGTPATPSVLNQQPNRNNTKFVNNNYLGKKFVSKPVNKAIPLSEQSKKKLSGSAFNPFR